MEDENIIWSDMSGQPSSANPIQGMNMMPRPIEPCQMKAYKSLYEELKDKCNPQKFMSPYNKEKVDMANRLYKRLLDTSESSTTALKEIRGQAMQQLGIQISTKELYQKLLKHCNPENFMDPYDFEAVQKANEYYALVEEYRNDISELERLEGEVMWDVALRGFYQKKEDVERKKRERIRKEQEAYSLGHYMIFVSCFGGVLFLILWALFMCFIEF